MEVNTPHALERIDEWFVAFKPSVRPFWWMRFLNPSFQHCLAFAYDPHGQAWIVVDPVMDGMFVRVLPDDLVGAYITALKQDGAVILRAEVQKTPVTRPRFALSCVTVISLLLGLNSAAQTPYRLYCALLKRGASESFVLSDNSKEID